MGNVHHISEQFSDESAVLENELTEEFFRFNYRLVSPIDCGGFGQVLRYEFEGRPFAVKEIKFGESGPIKLSDIRNEITILQYVNRLEPRLPYFVRYYGFSLFASQRIALIYELAEGNLSDLTEKRFLGLKDEALFAEYTHLLVSLVKALTFLELHNIAHRDLKPQNVLYKTLKSDPTAPKFSYLLCDFGISKLCDLGTQNFNTTGGSPIFMSPEVTFHFYNQIEKGVTNPFKSDVYSLGLLLLKVILDKNLSSKERMIEKDFDPSELDAGPNDMKIGSLIEEAYELFLRLSKEKYKINKFRIILRHMLMYNTKRRPDIFGIYSFLINMGFIKSYEEIDRWLMLKNKGELAKQMSSLMRQNEALTLENQRLRAENEALKADSSINKSQSLQARKEFDTVTLVRPFKSEKSFPHLERLSFSSSNSPQMGQYKRSFELPRSTSSTSRSMPAG